MQKMRHRFLVLLVAGIAAAFVVAFLSPNIASAQSKSLEWLRWDVDVTINTDGTFRVVETQEVAFIGGPFTFGFRNIPMDQVESITDIVVREGDTIYSDSRSESPNTYYTSFSGDELVINWFYPSTENLTRVWTIEYTVSGGLILFEDGDQLFWKAVPPNHDFPIGSSTVVVHLPPGATIDANMPLASYGTAAFQPEVSFDGTQVSFFSSGPIAAGDEFEVRVQWPHGIVQAQAPAWQAEWEQERAWDEGGRQTLNLLFGAAGVLLLFGGPVLLYLLWMLRGRDPKVGVVPTHLSEPPSDLEPGLAGTLVDEKADMEDIVATMVDLARRGVIEMEELKTTRLLGGKSTNFRFRLLGETTGLRPYERTLVSRMFGGKQEIKLTDLREKFYSSVSDLQRELYDETVAEGFFRTSPKKVRARFTGLGIAGLVLSAGIGFCVLGAFGSRIDALWCPFISLGITSIGMIIVGQAMPAKTPVGSEEKAKWEAFKKYIERIEDYTELEAATEQFDKYLPYAIAFGLEHSWVNKFSRVPSTPMPGWYMPYGMGRAGRGGPIRAGGRSRGGAQTGGSGDLRGERATPGPSLDGMAEGLGSGLSGMATGLTSMLNTTARTFRSSPSSSGSSGSFSGGGGFSGGGFSGGGGGGGGGGGFG